MTKDQKLIYFKSFLLECEGKLTHKDIAARLNKGNYVLGTVQSWLYLDKEIPDHVIPQLERMLTSQQLPKED